jgi:hypothetical protein
MLASAERLAVVTSAAVTALRQAVYAVRDPTHATAEWTNDALLRGTSLAAIVHPVLPLALTM